jgi:hypothetical protein
VRGQGAHLRALNKWIFGQMVCRLDFLGARGFALLVRQ